MFLYVSLAYYILCLHWNCFKYTFHNCALLFLAQTIQWNEHIHKKIYSTWPLFNLEGFQLIWKPLEWTGNVSNIPSYCKPCCVPEIHKFQIKKTTGYWFWKLLCNTRSLLPSLWEKISEWLSLHMGVVCKVLLPFSWGLLTPHFAQSTSTKILWCLFPFESQYCQTAIQIKHFGLALYVIQHFSPIQYTVLVHSTVCTVDLGNFYTTFFFSPPCWILCRSIANEQSLFNRLHLSYALSTTWWCASHLMSMTQYMHGCLTHIPVLAVL